MDSSTLKSIRKSLREMDKKTLTYMGHKYIPKCCECWTADAIGHILDEKEQTISYHDASRHITCEHKWRENHDGTYILCKKCGFQQCVMNSCLIKSERNNMEKKLRERKRLESEALMKVRLLT